MRGCTGGGVREGGGSGELLGAGEGGRGGRGKKLRKREEMREGRTHKSNRNMTVPVCSVFCGG